MIDRLFYAPVLDLDVLLPRIDELSSALTGATAHAVAEPDAVPREAERRSGLVGGGLGPGPRRQRPAARGRPPASAR